MSDILLNTAAAANAQGWELKDVPAVLSAVTAIVAVVFSYFATRRTLAVTKTNTEAAAWQKANELEFTTIQVRLDSFYGPFRQMSGVNRLMSRNLRNRQDAPHDFILLEKFFDQAWLDSRPAGERALLDEIAANGAKLREAARVHRDACWHG